MKILIIGGHLTPALSVIESLPKTARILYAGRRQPLEGDDALSFEYKTISEKGIPFANITTGRLQRTFTKRTIPSLFKLPKGFLQAANMLMKFKPDVIMSFGGYLSIPVCFSAKLLHIPIVIHEQTQHAGLANKIVGTVADKICLSWESSKPFFPKNKIVLTGNPLLRNSFKKERCSYNQFHEKIPSLVIVGGSSGSHAINVLIEGCLEQLLKQYTLIHQTGDAKQFMDFERFEKKKYSFDKKMQKRYHLYRYIDADHIGCVFRTADLIISRAGINTVTTLLILKKPTVCIPLPFSQRNEQFENARLLEKAGLAEVKDQSTLSSQELFDTIHGMLNNRKNYVYKHNEVHLIDPMNAGKKIVEVLYHAAEKGKQT